MKKWFENAKISKKLITGFLIVAILSVLVGAVGIIGIISIESNDTTLYEEDTVGLQYAGSTGVTFMQIRYNSLKRIYTDDQTSMEQIVAELNDNFSQMDELLAQCHETIKDPEITALLTQIQKDWDTYKSTTITMNEAALKGETQVLDQEIVTLGITLRDEFSTLFEQVSAAASKTAADNAANARNTVIIMLAVIVISFVTAMLLARYISGMISKPMQKFAAFAELLAVGDIDLKKVIEEKDLLLSKRKDEVGTLAGSFNKVVASTAEQAQKTQAIASGDLTTVITVRSEFDVIGKALTELVGKFHTLASSIVTSSDQVDSGSKLVAGSSMSLSQGATEQASAVEELTASLEEVTTQTTQNAQNAQTTDELAKSIKKDAEEGNSQMALMLSAMDEINNSSDSIGKIIKVIEDIAFQTNILALNAAVEAARAGQQGKGFAVVAEEVKNLAAQSTRAAKETTDLIGASIKKVQTGTKIANETAAALGKIVSGITEASQLINSIATKSNEQAAALEQINEGVMQVSQVVQSNAAVSEECAAASEELSGQADSLKTIIGVFKL